MVLPSKRDTCACRLHKMVFTTNETKLGRAREPEVQKRGCRQAARRGQCDDQSQTNMATARRLSIRRSEWASMEKEIDQHYYCFYSRHGTSRESGPASSVIARGLELFWLSDLISLAYLPCCAV